MFTAPSMGGYGGGYGTGFNNGCCNPCGPVAASGYGGGFNTGFNNGCNPCGTNMSATNYACCNPPLCLQPTQSSHGFATPGSGGCAQLVNRDVQYETDYVTVPVQRPILCETFQRVHDVPVEHCVEVTNVPAQECTPAITMNNCAAPCNPCC
eukprot:TRINITY_DN117977_c0_g1_i1.p2 TRINITY_DN117977_c0_g1~~TRINITY_DN117977_c0_g1_i1.p2  ORF type:complete len:163 (-),score=27.20 TRINITY_DN117977_c0_g1_i1:89-544(-)